MESSDFCRVQFLHLSVTCGKLSFFQFLSRLTSWLHPVHVFRYAAVLPSNWQGCCLDYDSPSLRARLGNLPVPHRRFKWRNDSGGRAAGLCTIVRLEVTGSISSFFSHKFKVVWIIISALFDYATS